MTSKDVISVRVSPETRIYFEKQSKKQGITLSRYVENFLIENKIWNVFSNEIGLIEIFRELFIALLDNLTNTQAKKLGEKLAYWLRDSIVFQSHSFSLDGLILIYEQWFKNNSIPYKVLSNQNHHVFVIKHGLGKNFSIMTLEAWKKLVLELNVNLRKLEVSSSVLSVEIKLK